MNVDQIRYALSKQIPALYAGFTINTVYGELDIDIDEAPRMVEIIERIYQKRLQKAEAQQ